MYVINTSSIKLDYGSIAEFCRRESIEEAVFFGLLKKKTETFHFRSKQRFAFERIRELGYIN